MREIKFRGRRVDNGEWVVGSLVQIDFHDGVDYVKDIHIVLPNGHCYDVKPETVGQCTGFPDKGGNEICEGDILAVPNHRYDPSRKNHTLRLEVKWIDGALFIADQYLLRDYEPDHTEIIGNVYENPELLEAKP